MLSPKAWRLVESRGFARGRRWQAQTSAALAAALVLAAAALVLRCAAASAGVPASATRFVAGFEVSTPARVANATAVGVTDDIEYNGPPRASSKLAEALTAAHMSVIDARISDELGAWECHRTHTVAPPPPEEENWFCKSDEEPSVNSPAVVLEAVRKIVREDAANPLVSGYWVLDDWPQWDGGSARALLKEIHAVIDEVTPALPAICGFGGTILPVGQTGGFELATAKNYSKAGCDMVGLYDYSEPRPKPSDGAELEWTIQRLLDEQQKDLKRMGWSESTAPMLGIGQAWSGRYGKHRIEYEPGLSSEQILQETRAFCQAGASAIGWWSWGDSQYVHKTLTPNSSSVIQAGIEQGIAACRELGAG